MRVFAALAAAPLLGAASPAAIQPAGTAPVQNPYADEHCPDTPMSLARKQGANPQTRRLGDLPPAKAFMAVDRRIDGCPVPMLASEARR